MYSVLRSSTVNNNTTKTWQIRACGPVDQRPERTESVLIQIYLQLASTP
jgi:hypothetical protein